MDARPARTRSNERSDRWLEDRKRALPVRTVELNTLRALSAAALVMGAWACGDDSDPKLTGGAGGEAGPATVTSTTMTSSSTSTSHSATASSGHGGQGGQGGAPPVGSLEADYCAPLAAFVCSQADSCGCDVIAPSGNFDQAACVAGYTQKCLDAYASVGSAIDAGLAVVMPDAAANCIALIQSSTPSCERPRGTVALGLCPTWFSGNEAIGDSCAFPFCAGGVGFCSGGTCVARPGEGDTCNSLECASGLLCLDGTCSAPLAAGGTCTTDDACAPPLRCVGGQCATLATAGQSCDDIDGCAASLVCSGETCSAPAAPPCSGNDSCGNLASCIDIPRCIAKLGENASCVSDDACGDGLYCDLDVNLCTALPIDGEACVNGTVCAEGLGCTTDFGNCAPLPGLGEACAFDLHGPFACQDGLGCVGDVCAALPVSGEPCTPDNRCAPSLGCDFTATGSFCVDPKPAGGDCQNDLVCATGLHCDFTVGQCAADQAIGSSCSLGNECGLSAVCLPGDGGQRVCTSLPGAGDPCEFDCAPSLFCSAIPANAVCAAPICSEL